MTENGYHIEIPVDLHLNKNLEEAKFDNEFYEIPISTNRID